MAFEAYEPALKLGIDSFLQHGKQESLTDLAPYLCEGYARTREESPLDWPEASDVVAAACGAFTIGADLRFQDGLLIAARARLGGNNPVGPFASPHVGNLVHWNC